MLTGAVEPILEAISLGRTDIIKKLVEEVEAEIKKSNKFENDQERGEITLVYSDICALFSVLVTRTSSRCGVADVAFREFINTNGNDSGNFLANAASTGAKDAVR